MVCIRWLLLDSLLHALSPYHLAQFGSALKRKTFQNISFGYAQHVMLNFCLKVVDKDPFLYVLGYFLNNTWIDLEYEWDHQVEHHAHSANPEGRKEKPRPIVSGNCGVHIHGDIPVVYYHHVEKSNKTRRVVIKIHQVPQRWRWEVACLSRVSRDFASKTDHPDFSENEENCV